MIKALFLDFYGTVVHEGEDLIPMICQQIHRESELQTDISPRQIGEYWLIGSRYLWIGSNYAPSLLAHLNWSHVVSAVHLQNTLGKAIAANANVLTAAICLSDHNRPSNVCAVPNIQHYEKQL